MIKVGIVMLFGSDWLGGVNYFNNLLHAVKMLPDNCIDFTLFTGFKVDDTKFKAFPQSRIIKSKIFDQYTIPWLCRKILHKLLNKDWMLEKLLKKHGIQLLSHSGIIGSRASLPTISWIPDFQHLHLPAFFSERELARRNQNFKNYAKWSTTLLLSSHDAFHDLLKFGIQDTSKVRVLNFVVNPQTLMSATPPLKSLQEKYHFSGRYFLLPNQFWAHKNHRVVIDALIELKHRKIPVLVLATGNTEDNRNSQFFSELKTYICNSGVEQEFKILGIIPTSDLYGLMANTDAVINPSLFEGWSTSVEEAKTLNKRILLSDIGVHREQSPPKGFYFNPNDAIKLADLMQSIIASDVNFQPNKEDLSLATKNFIHYGHAYHQLVMELTKYDK